MDAIISDFFEVDCMELSVLSPNPYQTTKAYRPLDGGNEKAKHDIDRKESEIHIQTVLSLTGSRAVAAQLHHHLDQCVYQLLPIPPPHHATYC